MNFKSFITMGICLCACASPARPAEGLAVFAAELLETCVVLVGTPGVLDLSSDGKTLSSSAGGLGLSADVTVTTTGTGFEIDISNPSSFATAPSGASSGATFSTHYDMTGVTSGIGILAGVTSLLDIGVTVVDIDMEVSRPTGFPAGTYLAQTVVTCE